MTYEKSQEAMRIAETLMPGGVNSPVRAFKSVDTPAIFMDHGEGSKIYDIDGNEYIDYVLSWGPLILGHKNKQVISKLHDLSLIHISEPTRRTERSRMPSSA